MSTNIFGEPVYDCGQCGQSHTEFDNGVCIDCSDENQMKLNDHNHKYDEWQKLSNSERQARIDFES